ncbi:ribosome biogenesis GTPase YlqF, partial [Ligilactobacillus ruminis]
MTVIQWYPGHMAKALRQVKENLNAVDIVLELVDARLPESSRNPQLEELLQNKKSIIVLTKMDLADPKLTREWITYYEQNGHPAIAVNSNQGTLPAIEKKIKEVLKEKIAAKEARGIKNSRIKAMCIGIPNVGKSTLLNRLVKKNVAIVGNKPGVTKAQQWLKAGSSLLL